MLRKLICGTLWALATGVTAAIVYLGMGTSSWIVTALGAIGIISASCGIYIAMDARKHGARAAFIGGLLLWLLGEAFVIPSEINFWSATVTAKAEREMDYQRQANGRRLILDNTAKQLTDQAPMRPVGEIQADINAALAKTYGRKTLAFLTASCTDLSSPAIRFCRDVFAFQKELSASQDRKTKSSLVWEANSQLAVNTAEAHGAHDGPARLAELFGGTPVFWSNVILAVTILLLWFNRGFGLAMGSVKTKARALAVPTFSSIPEEKRETPAAPEVNQIETKVAAVTSPALEEEPTPITPAATAEESLAVPVTEEAPKEDAAPVTPAAEAANDNAVTEVAAVTPTAIVTDEAAHVTLKKRGRKRKDLFQEVDLSNVTAFPKIHSPIWPIDHLNEAIDAFIDEHHGTGDPTSAAIGHRRIKAVLKRAGAPRLISKDQFGDLVRDRCRMRGLRVDSSVGRQWHIVTDDKTGKKGNKRLGDNSPVSIPA